MVPVAFSEWASQTFIVPEYCARVAQPSASWCTCDAAPEMICSQRSGFLMMAEASFALPAKRSSNFIKNVNIAKTFLGRQKTCAPQWWMIRAAYYILVYIWIYIYIVRSLDRIQQQQQYIQFAMRYFLLPTKALYFVSWRWFFIWFVFGGDHRGAARHVRIGHNFIINATTTTLKIYSPNSSKAFRQSRI